MSIRTGYRDDRINSVFLRSIGRITLACWELREIRDSGDLHDNAPWVEFADHLIHSCDAIVEGAVSSTLAGNTISILRDGVRIAVDEQHIDKVAEKVQRHIQVARALGAGLTPDPELGATA
jgi:hypothetical protein